MNRQQQVIQGLGQLSVQEREEANRKDRRTISVPNRERLEIWVQWAKDQATSERRRIAFESELSSAEILAESFFIKNSCYKVWVFDQTKQRMAIAPGDKPRELVWTRDNG